MTQVRQAVAADERDILDLLVQLLEGLAPLYQSDWANSGDALSSVRDRIEKRQVLVAEVDGNIVGAVSWRPRVAPPPHRMVRYAELETLFVVPDWREQGIAHQLCERVQRACLEQAIPQVRVERRLGAKETSLFAAVGFVEYEKTLIWPRKSLGPSGADGQD
ncbi:MAG: GNAT family N-acetyltransferase [Burkholderiaceae bacterium]